MRRHIPYANVAATLAIAFSMGGVAVAARHFLITSTSQIAPGVLRQLRGHRGPRGATGPRGERGLQGRYGPRGPGGPTGPAGTGGTGGSLSGSTSATGGAAAGVSAVTLGAELAAGPTPEEKVLFKLGEVSASLSCSGGAAAPEAVLSASGPSGAHADSGLTATNLEGRPPEGYPDLVNDVVLGPAPATVVKLATNAKAPAENVASLSATITTPAQVVQVNAYIDVKPSSFPNCLVHGSAYSVPATS